MGTEPEKRADAPLGKDEWQEPQILESGKVEAKLYSDEPDPWGP